MSKPDVNKSQNEKRLKDDKNKKASTNQRETDRGQHAPAKDQKDKKGA